MATDFTHRWNVPSCRSRSFSGRQDLLADIGLHLSSESPVALVQHTSGLGGVGKREVALAWVDTHRQRYQLVWWIDAHHPLTLAVGLAALGDLVAPTGASPLKVRVEAARKWLASHHYWLLVLDDASDPSDVAAVLPQPLQGDILITSRNPWWEGVATSLGVGPLPRAEAVDFLLRRVGLADAAEAALLAETLGDLPLALELVGGYISSQGGDLALAHQRFQRRHKELWGEDTPRGEALDRVATAVSLSIDVAQVRDPAALPLLSVLSWVAPTSVSSRCLVDMQGDLPPELEGLVDPPRMARCLELLGDLGLVNLGPETFTLHSLTQALVRGRLEDDEREHYAQAALTLISRVWNRAERGDTVPGCGLVSHILAVVESTESLPSQAGRRVSLLRDLASWLQHVHAWDHAVRVLEQALTIAQNHLDMSHPEVGPLFAAMGEVARHQNDDAAGWEAWERAIVAYELAEGTQSPGAARAREELADLMRRQEQRIRQAQAAGFVIHHNPRT